MTGPRIACAGAVVRDGEGRLLLVRRRNPPAAGSWSVPGGRIEPGETAAAAAAREVAEETGLQVEVGAQLIEVRRGDFDIRDFEAVVVGGDLAAGDDATEAGWFTPHEVAALPTSPGLVAALRAAGVLPADSAPKPAARA